jgi:hypothetical protein
MKYTKELLEPIVTKSFSIAEVLRALGCRENGSIHSHISKIIKKYNISTIHFLGCGHAKGKSSNKHRDWQSFLVKRNDNKRQKSYFLRRALIESGRTYECVNSKCNIKGEWLGQKLTLQVNHMNGDISDDRSTNLEFLCPNCHSQQSLHWCQAWKEKGADPQVQL